MKKLCLFIILIGCLARSPSPAFAGQQGGLYTSTPEYTLEQQLDALDFNQVDAVISKGGHQTNGLGLRDLTVKAIQGELDLSPAGLGGFISGHFFREVAYHKNLMQRLVAIGILSAILSNLTGSFKNKSVGELGFYVSYVVLVMLLLTSFQAAASVMTGLISDLSSLMEASLPLMLTLIAMSGNVSGAYVFHPAMIFVLHFITAFIKNIFVPVLVMASAIEILNYISERSLLSKFSSMAKGGASWVLRIIAMLFLGILSLQKISTPIMDNLIVKTAKASASAIPVVGGLLGGAVDTVLNFASAAKSGVLVALFIVIISACALPVLEMLALLVIYKLTSAVIQPICDKRIVDCIDSVGSFTALILSGGITVIIMFLFAVMILLSF